MTQAVDLSAFGTDLDWSEDMLASAGMTSGYRLLAQRALHRLSTPRGACLDSPDDGLDLAEFLSKGLTQTEIDSIPGEVAAELRKDEAFVDADVTLTQFVNGFNLDIRISLSDGSDLQLVFGVDQAGTRLLAGP